MDNREKLFKLFKQIAGIGFAISFVFAVFIFTDIGNSYIPKTTAKYLFISFGGIAILFNLLSFERGKHNPTYSFVYWTGMLITFFGLTARLLQMPYSLYIMIAGILILGASFMISSKRKEQEKPDDLLDN